MELKSLFEAAVAKSKTITTRPSNDTLLQLYALYKQATDGDNNAKKPGMFDLVGQAKYDAWAKLKGKSSDEAMQMYVDLMDSLTK
jgi:diazepam-binding inhibitor (GABA receptor modulator, acyl-CoA-binding protein)